MRQFASLLFLFGFAFFLSVLVGGLPFGAAPMQVGQAIVEQNIEATGAANAVTGVLLAFRGMDTLGELTILFVAATAAGMVVERRKHGVSRDSVAGFILLAGAELMFPFLLILGAYVILHGHLTPGGGFQGGAILAAAFFVPFLANPGRAFQGHAMAFVEAFAGATFILLGIFSIFREGDFMAPMFLGTGEFGQLVSAGSLPLLYLALGLKVGAELGSLVAEIAAAPGSDDPLIEEPQAAKDL